MFFRTQVRLTTDTGAQRDICTNTYHFITDEIGTPGDELTDIHTALETLYQAIDTHLSENLATSCEFRSYDMEDPPDRVPLLTSTHTLVPGTGALPNQMAVPVNLEGTQVSGEPRGRKRGRVFIGPLASNGMQDVIGDTEIPGATRNGIGNAFGVLLPLVPSSGSGSTIRLCVFSKLDALGLPVGAAPPSSEPTYTGPQLTAGFVPVTRIRISDRLGVQRSRRKAPAEFITYT